MNLKKTVKDINCIRNQLFILEAKIAFSNKESDKNQLRKIINEMLFSETKIDSTERTVKLLNLTCTIFGRLRSFCCV